MQTGMQEFPKPETSNTKQDTNNSIATMLKTPTKILKKI